MRPHFAIYLAAGLTLFFAVLLAFTHIGEAYYLRRAANMLQLTGDDLARNEAVRDNHFGSAAETLTLAGIQGVIIFYTWKWRKQKGVAENPPAL
jgi:hypothetical protein